MKRIINHVRIWNIWRRNSLNNRFYKFLVLLGLVNSPTFRIEKIDFYFQQSYESLKKELYKSINAFNEFGSLAWEVKKDD